MKFVQTIEYQSSRPEEMMELSQRWRDESQGQGSARRVLVCADRDRPNTFISIVEFDSYEAAMANSNDPQTSAFAEQMAKLCDGPPTFRNCDVIDEFQP